MNSFPLRPWSRLRPWRCRAPRRRRRRRPERLKALARSYGADEVCITDPYMMVKEPDGYVLCAACNKRLDIRRQALFSEALEA